MPRIHELLQTKKRGEQEKRVQELIQIAQSPVLAILVQMDGRSGKLEVRVAGAEQPPIEDVKFVLRRAVDMLTEQGARAQAEQEQNQQVPPDMANDVSEVRQHAREYIPDPTDDPARLDENEEGDPDPLYDGEFPDITEEPHGEPFLDHNPT